MEQCLALRMAKSVFLKMRVVCFIPVFIVHISLPVNRD